jgi:alpha-mannosidase
MVDKVYTDAVRGYEFSHRLGQQMVGTWWDGLTSKIDTTGDGIPVVVFNSLGWPRSDLAEVNVGFTDAGVTDIGLVDASGQAVPVQVEEAEHSADGVLKGAKIAFVARDVPALGYSVYQVIPKRGTPTAAVAGRSRTFTEDSASIENEYYRATFDLRTGEMTGLLVKSTNWRALNGPANVVTREQDGGDFWELYGNLGAGEIAQTRKVLLPRPGKTQWSSEWMGSYESPKVGPVFSECGVSHPFGNGDFATRVRLYAGIPRIDIHTQILNNDRFVRYRVSFPTSIKNGKRVDEIPFGAIERPSSQEFPAQNWFDYGDGTQGLSVLNRGLPGSNVVDGTLLLSLMRSARITAYPIVEGYEEGVSSDSGLELGKRMTFDYALVPHDGDWRQAGAYRSGLEFNNPLIARKVAPHAGTLPKRWGLLEVSKPNVVVSTLKPGRDGSAVLRVYEASGQSTPGVKIALHSQVDSAFEANLIEQPGGKLNVQDNALQFDLGPFQIKTFQLRLGSSRSR